MIIRIVLFLILCRLLVWYVLISFDRILFVIVLVFLCCLGCGVVCIVSWMVDFRVGEENVLICLCYFVSVDQVVSCWCMVLGVCGLIVCRNFWIWSLLLIFVGILCFGFVRCFFVFYRWCVMNLRRSVLGVGQGREWFVVVSD